jgi:hypothetical protein
VLRQLTIAWLLAICPQLVWAQQDELRTEFDQAQYAAYSTGDWTTVVRMYANGKGLADFNFSHQRAAYAYLMIGRHRKAIGIFNRALKDNPTSDFCLKWRYTALVMNGQRQEALLAGGKLPRHLATSIKVIRPKFLRSIGLGGGYRVSDTPKMLGSQPLGWLQVGHELGQRGSLRHGISFISQSRYYEKVWQLAYFLQADVAISQRLTAGVMYSPSFWQTDKENGTDHSFGAHLRARLGAVDLDVFGGAQRQNYIDSTDAAIGLSATWYPWGNLKYSLTGTYSHHFLQGGSRPSLRISASALLIRGLWLMPTFTLGNERIAMEAGRFEPSNNSPDVLKRRVGASFLFNPKGTYAVSLSYLHEARKEAFTSIGINYHCIYAGFTYNFN